MKKYVVIAPLGDNMDALFKGIKEFPTERIILITPKNKKKEAEGIVKDLSKFKIPVRILEIEDNNLWEQTFEAVSKIKNIESDENLIINVATGDKNTQCAATSASFVNGIKAFSIEGNEAMLLPVLKFSYYKILTDKKMNILKILSDKDCCASLQELSKRAKMSLPLISYHINGTYKSEGLKGLGLVEVEENKGKFEVSISTLGKLLIKGHVPQLDSK